MAKDRPSPPEDTASGPRHGGDLAWARQRYGEPSRGWLDLSTGINPVPYPAQANADLTLLPDRGGLAALEASARDAYGLPSTPALIAVPGSEIALRLLPLTTEHGTIALVGPTYSSHDDAWTAAGHVVFTVGAIESIPDDATVAVICNPNNPDGRLVQVSELATLARRLGDRGGFLVVDEAFADVAPEISLLPHLKELPAVVLRSFGKFYGLAGLRLGFLAGDPSITGLVESLLGDWPVSSAAIAIGTAALADDAWRDATRARLAEDANRMADLLATHRFDVIGGTDLFVLIDDEDARTIHERLARQGVWTRIFAGEPRWLRMGLPPPDGFERFDRALRNVR